MNIQKIKSAQDLPDSWDCLTESYLQSREFLIYAEKHNPCNQTYYIQTKNDTVIAGAIAYLLTKKVGIINNTIKTIGIPVSTGLPGMIGQPTSFKELICEIINEEPCITFHHSLDILPQIPNIIEITSPSCIIGEYAESINSIDDLIDSMNSSHKRRVRKAIAKFKDIQSITGSCQNFSIEHYHLYLEVQNRRESTKLETLSLDFFINLPEIFQLTSYYREAKLLAWHINIYDKNTLYFFLGGTDYSTIKTYDSFFNNLIGIVQEGLLNGYKTIDFGPTAEQSKMNLGAKLVPKKMYLYHPSRLVRFFIHINRRSFCYNYKGPFVMNIFNNK